MINESTSTDPVCAKHNGHHSFLQVLFLFPIEYFSSRQSFFSADPHARSKLGSNPSFFFVPSSDLTHHRHCVGEPCFGLDINLSEHRICTKRSIIHEDFPEFVQCAFSQLHCSWAVFIFSPGSSQRLLHLVFPAFPPTNIFWDIVIRQAFRIQHPGTSFLSPFPWRLLRVCRQTLRGAQGFDDGTNSTRLSTKGKSKAQGDVRQTRCDYFSVSVR